MVFGCFECIAERLPLWVCPETFFAAMGVSEAKGVSKYVATKPTPLTAVTAKYSREISKLRRLRSFLKKNIPVHAHGTCTNCDGLCTTLWT